MAQAEADLRAANTTAAPHADVSCFLAQQAAEKAMKAVQLAVSGVVARTPSLSRLEAMLAELGLQLAGVTSRALRELERLNIEARYPDALPDAVPAEYFTEDDARHAIAIAEAVVTAVRRLLG